MTNFITANKPNVSVSGDGPDQCVNIEFSSLNFIPPADFQTNKRRPSSGGFRLGPGGTALHFCSKPSP